MIKVVFTLPVPCANAAPFRIALLPGMNAVINTKISVFRIAGNVNFYLWFLQQ